MNQQQQSLIVYGSQSKLSREHRPVHGQKQPQYFVRVKLVNIDYERALQYARTKAGETVLNTVPII